MIPEDSNLIKVPAYLSFLHTAPLYHINHRLTYLLQWGLFDLADNPPPRFWQNHAMIIGDAAHASTPHHGAGAGFGMEDVAVLKGLFQELLELGGGVEELEHVFAQFDASRRERDQWLVQSSRRAADLYESRLEGMDAEEMRRDIEARQEICWGFDIEGCMAEAKKGLRARLEGTWSVNELS